MIAWARCRKTLVPERERERESEREKEGDRFKNEFFLKVEIILRNG